ncbi:precorrin-8X methylmutase [Neosynechococcus sphagnicola]|uniref:precorrin-8X methylmutase n=1 Tax=Neosynechococcus sphagnicola TaxID=1501145 RepID=UPI003083F274
MDAETTKSRLQETLVAHIRIEGRKGSPVVASAIFNGLVELSWQAYGQDGKAVYPKA